MLPKGMAVNPGLHPLYWEARSSYDNILAAWSRAAKPMPREFLLTDCGQIVGGGVFDPADGPHEMAWLNCMFAELHGWKVSVQLPDGLSRDEMAALVRGLILVTDEEGEARHEAI